MVRGRLASSVSLCHEFEAMQVNGDCQKVFWIDALREFYPEREQGGRRSFYRGGEVCSKHPSANESQMFLKW